MTFYRTFLAVVLLIASSAQASIISGTVTSFFFNGGAGGPASSPIEFGNGVHSVTSFWGSASLHRGYIHGNLFPEGGDGPIHYSNVAFAVGVTDISQITEASIFSFSDSTPILCDAICDPDGVGDFAVTRNVLDGYYGVLRIDRIDHYNDDYDTFGLLQATWWFQTDGTGNFTSPVPEPSSYLMFGIGMLALLGYRVRDLALLKPV